MYGCADCGYEYDLDEAEAVGPLIVSGARGFASTLRDGDAARLRVRPEPETWSVLEYGCHLRDVFLAQRERVLRARREELPEFEPMGRDERVEHDGYALQDPADVARQLDDAALMLANDLARLDAAGWERQGIYNFPVRSERTMRWVAVHTLHEVRHHTRDIEAQLVER